MFSRVTPFVHVAFMRITMQDLRENIIRDGATMEYFVYKSINIAYRNEIMYNISKYLKRSKKGESYKHR